MMVHPVRAGLAGVAMIATAAGVVLGYDLPDAWWTAFGAIIAFYFTASN